MGGCRNLMPQPTDLVRSNSYSAEVWTPVITALKTHNEALQQRVLEMFQGVGPDQMTAVCRESNKAMMVSAQEFAQQNVEIMTSLWDEYSDGRRCSQMLPDNRSCSQMLADALKCC